jgi:hypothetical protein
MSMTPSGNYAQQHPLMLPYLDAATALVRPQSTLRQRIYLTAAILETTPAYAAEFLPRMRTSFELIAVIVWNAIHTAVKAAIGLRYLRGRVARDAFARRRHRRRLRRQRRARRLAFGGRRTAVVMLDVGNEDLTASA